jgi:signal transduction histidine kinase
MRSGDASTRRETRFRRARVLLFFVVAICLTQVGWWIFFQVRESGRERDVAVLVERVDPQRAEARRAARVRMAIGEGLFLAFAMIGGVASLYWLMGRELRREYEQNQLLAAVSHDFRSPLTAIRLIAQSFELGRLKEADRGRMARTLVSNTRRLEDLVENVLATSRLHAGKLHASLEPVDLGEELERCVEQRRALFDERGVVLERAIEPGVIVQADRGLLHCALGNLLDNAMKYSPGQPKIALTVARDGAKARLVVKDSGLGFDPDLTPRLFERFQRGDAERDRSRPGLGLGLYLTKEVVRLHGGTVQARSAGANTGSEFTLLLPGGTVPGTKPPARARETTDRSAPDASDPAVQVRVTP